MSIEADKKIPPENGGIFSITDYLQKESTYLLMQYSTILLASAASQTSSTTVCLCSRAL
jgi:hypothetical protein